MFEFILRSLDFLLQILENLSNGLTSRRCVRSLESFLIWRNISEVDGSSFNLLAVNEKHLRYERDLISYEWTQTFLIQYFQILYFWYISTFVSFDSILIC